MLLRHPGSSNRQTLHDFESTAGQAPFAPSAAKALLGQFCDHLLVLNQILLREQALAAAKLGVPPVTLSLVVMMSRRGVPQALSWPTWMAGMAVMMSSIGARYSATVS